jgi:hypothetical protein
MWAEILFLAILLLHIIVIAQPLAQGEALQREVIQKGALQGEATQRKIAPPLSVKFCEVVKRRFYDKHTGDFIADNTTKINP